MKRAKITVIGAGNVGATCAQYCAMAGLGDVYLLDIPVTKDMPKGKALDMFEASPVLGFTANVVGTTDYADTVNSDVVVVTAGITGGIYARRSVQSVYANSRIVSQRRHLQRFGKFGRLDDRVVLKGFAVLDRLYSLAAALRRGDDFNVQRFQDAGKFL